jgi:hypothetical protein
MVLENRGRRRMLFSRHCAHHLEDFCLLINTSRLLRTTPSHTPASQAGNPLHDCPSGEDFKNLGYPHLDLTICTDAKTWTIPSTSTSSTLREQKEVRDNNDESAASLRQGWFRLFHRTLPEDSKSDSPELE